MFLDRRLVDLLTGLADDQRRAGAREPGFALYIATRSPIVLSFEPFGTIKTLYSPVSRAISVTLVKSIGDLLM